MNYPHRKSPPTLPQAGFTLVEIATVVVIIGILIAGMLKGMDMMEKAKLDSVIASLQKYKSVTKDFTTKYNYLPGDLIQTDRYFTATQCPDNGTNTCGGNGDGRIRSLAGAPQETLRAWQHLALAEFIPGSYTGQRTLATTSGIVIKKTDGTNNVPASELESRQGGIGGFFFFFGSTAAPYLGNFIQFGRDPVTQIDTNIAGILSSKNALVVDRKIDDGTPQNGILLATDSTVIAPTSGCLSGTAYANAGSVQSCVLWFKVD